MLSYWSVQAALDGDPAQVAHDNISVHYFLVHMTKLSIVSITVAIYYFNNLLGAGVLARNKRSIELLIDFPMKYSIFGCG